MTNKTPRELAIQQTGLRTYQIKVKLLDEEVVDQETICKKIHGIVDYTMNELKEQKCIPADSEASIMKTSQMPDNNVVICVKWHTASNDYYIVCDTLDAVITTAKQMKQVSHILDGQNHAVYKDPAHRKYAIRIDLPSDTVACRPLEASLIHICDYNDIHVLDSLNFPVEYWAEHGEMICKDLFMLTAM